MENNSPSPGHSPISDAPTKYATLDEFVSAHRQIQPSRDIDRFVQSYHSGERQVEKLIETQRGIDATENPKEYARIDAEIEKVETGNRYAVSELCELTGLDNYTVIEGLSVYIDKGKRRGSPSLTDFYENATRDERQLADIYRQARLTAATPKLLEACQLAIVTLQALEDQLPENQAMQELADTLREAVEAAV